ncbi:hypothetical protein ACTFIY_007087 [Dictyostelium cf. discoideum]
MDKDNEVTNFLVNAFHYLSIAMTVLNYLLLTNKQSISSATLYQHQNKFQKFLHSVQLHQTNGTQLDLLPDGSSLANNANNNSSNKDRTIKTAKIAGAAVTGAPVLVGMTGGLAAPFIGMMLNFVGGAGSIVVAGITGATGLSGATMLSVIFGVAGAKVSAGAMISATSGGGIKDYQIHKIKSQTLLDTIIGVYGICNDIDEWCFRLLSN